MIIVNIKARKSDTGKLNHTPFAPKNLGRKYKEGIKNKICLESDKVTDFFTIPRLWKRFVEIIWKPTTGKIIFIALSPFAAISFNVSS